jgi:hypothetical protein
MCLLVVLLLAGVLQAETPKLEEPYRSLVDLAQAAPPEFAADAMLRVAESGKITDRDAVRDLVEQAFHTASAATFRVRMRGLPGTTTDTRSGLLSQAYDLKLDALSLQSRAVRDMLAIDKAKARDLFRDIPPPRLVPLTCDDAMVYDVADFYRTIGIIANTAFSEKERAKEEHINFVLDYVGQVVSPAQLAPLARVLKSVNATPVQAERLWNRFNGMLEDLLGDERSYSAALSAISSESGPEMQASFEKYKRQGQSCKDDAGGAAEPAANTPKLERFWQTPQAKTLLEDGLKLRIAPDSHQFTAADRSTPEWQVRLTDYLSELADWTSGQEQSEAVYYHQKCTVFEALVELIPAGPQRDKVLLDFVAFIGNSNLQRQSPVEWFIQANSVLERVRHSNDATFSKLFEAYEHSGNSILALEIALEKTLGAKLPASVTGEN